MAGLVPAISARKGALPIEMAGTRPAMTDRRRFCDKSPESRLNVVSEAQECKILMKESCVDIMAVDQKFMLLCMLQRTYKPCQFRQTLERGAPFGRSQ